MNPLIHKGLRNNFSFDVFDNNLIVNMRKIAYWYLDYSEDLFEFNFWLHFSHQIWIFLPQNWFFWVIEGPKKLNLIFLEPVISMSPEHISVIPNLSQIKYISVLPIRPISWNLYRPKCNLGQIWNNRNVFRTHWYNWLYFDYS